MIAAALALTAVAVIAVAIASFLTRRVNARKFNALLATGNSLSLLSNVILDNTTVASVSAAGLALSLWLWWKGGGGDGTRRRLRSAARRFQGVRRTAPVGSVS